MARAIVTQGMRVSPPEPTFLDERDAILTADRQLFPDGDHSGAIWSVFATRGMGSDARARRRTSRSRASSARRPRRSAVSPSPAAQGQPVTLDASGSSDPDGSVVSYDFDFQGDGTPDVTGTTNPRQSFTYAGAGTFHPRVTVHDDEGQADTAARRLDVVPPRRRRPRRRRPRRRRRSRRAARPRSRRWRTGARGGACASRSAATPACAGHREADGDAQARQGAAPRQAPDGRQAARRLIAKAGQQRFTIKLSQRTLRAMRRAGVRRLVAQLSVTVTDPSGSA